MEYFPLLLAKGERSEGALVAVADGKAREESFYVLELERQGEAPTETR